MMNRLEQGPFALPTASMPGHQSVFVDQSDFFHRGHDDQLPVRVLHRDRVVVRIEPHEGLRISRCGNNVSSLEGLRRQRQEGGLVFPEQLSLWTRLPTRALCQVGHATYRALRSSHSSNSTADKPVAVIAFLAKTREDAPTAGVVWFAGCPKRSRQPRRSITHE
jgi:hypothetical protein